MISRRQAMQIAATSTAFSFLAPEKNIKAQPSSPITKNHDKNYDQNHDKNHDKRKTENLQRGRLVNSSILSHSRSQNVHIAYDDIQRAMLVAEEDARIYIRPPRFDQQNAANLDNLYFVCPLAGRLARLIDREVQKHSLPRQVLFTEEIPPGAIPCYCYDSAETHPALSSNADHTFHASSIKENVIALAS